MKHKRRHNGLVAEMEGGGSPAKVCRVCRAAAADYDYFGGEAAEEMGQDQYSLHWLAKGRGNRIWLHLTIVLPQASAASPAVASSDGL